MRRKRLTALIVTLALALCCAVTVAACGEPPEVKVNNVTLTVTGYEWGPAIPKLTVEFSDTVSEIAADTFTVKTGANKRTVTKAYMCDETGKEISEKSKYVAFEMSVKYGEANPFEYANNKNDWADSISVSLTAAKAVKVGKTSVDKGKKFTYRAGAENRVVPQTASWDKDTVTHNEGGKTITLQRASWKPEGAESDGGKNPLVIWLHGMGEGGTDIDIALLGNEVTALTSENSTNIQHHFITSTCKGAYVLAVQTPTMWMDDGDGTNNVDKPGTDKQVSMYTEALYKAITSYVEGNSDIDTNRIYLGGCSNGGYMTMNMMFEHGDYFTAFYPVCEAYNDAKISDDMINAVKDYKIWFLQSQDDRTVDMQKFVVPTYMRLLNAGAQNINLTLTDKVRGVDDPNPSSWTGTGSYDGHWVWIYAFNDKVEKKFDNSAITAKEDITHTNCTVNGNMWQWLAAQTKAA